MNQPPPMPSQQPPPEESESVGGSDASATGSVAGNVPPPPLVLSNTQPIPVVKRDPDQDEVLRKALDRADRAMQMVDSMQSAMDRNYKRLEIERTIDINQSQHQRARDLLQAVFWGNFVVLAIVFAFGATTRIDSVGEILSLTARVAGLASTYLLLVQLLLVGRLPFLDQVYGMDKLTRFHRLNGHISFDLALLHAYCAVMARSVLWDQPVAQIWDEVISYKFMVPAVLGTLMMAAAIATSITNARRKYSHDIWHFFHMWTYVGVAMSLGHQLYGPDFLGRPVAQAYLWGLYLLTFAVLGYSRLAVPFINMFRHQLRVAEVVQEGPGVTSIYMTGFRLDRFRAKPGQFCWWRFLSNRDWRESHPFSLSIAPNDKYVRITVKSLGDFSSRVNEIPIGTWVTFEGPFGGFTPDKRTKFRTVLVAGGVGITPIRSLLEGLPAAPGDIAVIYRADKIEDAVLLHELEELATQREAVLHVVLGSRGEYPADCQPLSPQHLRMLVPDIARRDVYICASPGMTAAVRGTLKSMGLREQQVHHETF
jgi:predicted ferric reductase